MTVKVVWLLTGVIQTGTDTDGKPIYEPFTKTLNQEETRDYWGNLGERAEENFIYDASFIKLRQVSLGIQPACQTPEQNTVH